MEGFLQGAFREICGRCTQCVGSYRFVCAAGEWSVQTWGARCCNLAKERRRSQLRRCRCGSPPVQRYREIHENGLIGALNAGDAPNRDIGEWVRLQRVPSGMHDQTARSAASR